MHREIQGHEFSQLRAFVAVAERCSFSRAAEDLGITPSSLSQTIRGLEARIGARLLNRTTRSVSLTSAGERLFDRVKPAINELTAAVGDIVERAGRVRGRVRLLVGSLAADLLIRPHLAAFCTRFPDVVLDIAVEDGACDLVRAGFDAAIWPGQPGDKDLVVSRIGPELSQVVVGAPAYLDRCGRPKRPNDLAGHACLRWRGPDAASSEIWSFTADKAQLEVAVAGPLVLTSRAMVLQATAEGIGLARLTSREAQPWIDRGALEVVLGGWIAPAVGFSLCYPAQRLMDPALRSLIDFLRAAGAGTRETPIIFPRPRWATSAAQASFKPLAEGRETAASGAG